MNEVTLAFVWGLGFGAIVGLFVGFYLGGEHQMFVAERSEYAKKKREFEEMAARVRKAIDERRDELP